MSEALFRGGADKAKFRAPAQGSSGAEQIASVTPITDAPSSPARRESTRLNIKDPRHVDQAARILTETTDPVFVQFGNIHGVFGHPSDEAVSSINEFKGRKPDQVGSITTTQKHWEGIADWSQLDPEAISKGTALEIVRDLSNIGPIGAVLPAAEHIPGLLSKKDAYNGGPIRTVQLIVPGTGAPAEAVFSRAADLMPDKPFVFATSGNTSKAVNDGKEQPAHHRYEDLVAEFESHGHDGITVITAQNEARAKHKFPYNDHRSTSILRLHDVVRQENGEPQLDEQGRKILEVTRDGSMHQGVLREVLANHGYGVIFPAPEKRVPIRDYSEAERRMRALRTKKADILYRLGMTPAHR